MKNGMLTVTLILAAMPVVRTAQVPASEIAPTTRKVSFNREVFPILADRCFTCHGPDAKARKANLRLDRADGEDGAYRTHEGSTAIKPGSLRKSQLWHRITTDDADEIQPLLDRLRKDGRSINRVQAVRENLEDLFMRAVTDESGQVAAPGAIVQDQPRRGGDA